MFRFDAVIADSVVSFVFKNFLSLFKQQQALYF